VERTRRQPTLLIGTMDSIIIIVIVIVIVIIIIIIIIIIVKWGHAVAQWLRHCATNRKVPGSIPDGATRIFH
jgi:hypothetical protein